MKKTLLLIVALMPCLLALSQEAKVDSDYAEFTITPRLEINPTYNSDDGFGFDLGNSSIYSLFEGQYSNLSWTLANHWLNYDSDNDYGWPYTSLGYSHTTNFIDYMVVNYNLGSWTFSLGKDMIKTGGMEFEEWDWEIHTTFATPLWNTLASYQWGVSATWEITDLHSLSLQATTSPFGNRPFSSKLFAYSAQYRGEIDWLSLIWSVSALERASGEFDYLVALGQQFRFSDSWSLDLDWNNSYCMGGVYDIEDNFSSGFMVEGNTLKSVVKHTFSDELDLGAYFVFASPKNLSDDDFNSYSAGVALNYYPLDDLRLHAIAAYSNDIGAILNIGAIYNLRLVK